MSECRNSIEWLAYWLGPFSPLGPQWSGAIVGFLAFLIIWAFLKKRSPT